MKRTAFLLSLILITFSIGTNSCKEKIRGCTDPDSYTYDPAAEKDDGSCRYEGRAVIWYNQQASTGLTNDGAVALTFYVNGEVVGSSAATVFWPQAPGCGDEGSITVTEDLGRNKVQDLTLSVKDQDGIEYWNTKMTFEGNSCLALELTWSGRKK